MSDDKKPYGLANVALDTLLGRVEYASNEVREQRLAICHGCPLLNAKLMQCTDCGCFVKVKTKYKDASCPKAKW